MDFYYQQYAQYNVAQDSSFWWYEVSADVATISMVLHENVVVESVDFQIFCRHIFRTLRDKATITIILLI